MSRLSLNFIPADQTRSPTGEHNAIIRTTSLRRELLKMINREIRAAKNKKPAAITLKINSLSDEELIGKLYDAAQAGVEIKLIVRGIFCMFSENSKFIRPV